MGLLCLVTGGLVIGAVLFIDRRMERVTRGRIFADAADIPECYAALVLGARVMPDKTPSAMLEDRIRAAVDLYKAGKVKKLLMSGDNSKSTYDEVTVMRDYAIGLGVDPDDVLRDFAGFRTYDSIYRARELWDVRDAIIVTQRFHLPRSLYLAQKLGVDAWGFVADRRRYYAPSMKKARFREVLGRTAGWLDANLLKPEPHFLGQKEGWSGNAQKDTPP